MSTVPSPFANGDSAGFWAAARSGHLEFQGCRVCGHVQFPPRVQCAKCWSDDLAPVRSSGNGVIESVTIVRRAPLAKFRDQTPYAVAAVAMEEGPRMITSLVGDDALDAAIGDAVTVRFTPDADGNILPRFAREQT